MNRLSPLISSLLLTMAANAFAIEGIYTGYIELYEPEGVQVPVQLSLTLTGERVFTPRGDERPVIDASLLVGEEGGPFACSNVDLDVDEAEIDIRYERPKNNMSETSPSNFRLVGKLKSQMRIEGRVLSGTRGPVGTFVLDKSRSETLNMKIIYKGSWSGEATSIDGFKVPFELTLTPTQDATVNPSEYEFEYSLGKIGAIKWNNTRLSFDQVYVDYVRREVYLFKSNSRGSAGISVKFFLRKDGSISGSIDSALRGAMAEFDLTPKN